MSTGFQAKPEFFTAMDAIVTHPDCSADTNEFITKVVSNVRRTGYVSERQAKCVGGTYKAVVNNGVYIKHDWWH